ncbi:MAG: PfkB family carbohydrate kinase [Actinobacteria bacterium]|nr:PfkB family carbohydrate kinase [Actinomycetota bacterium]
MELRTDARWALVVPTSMGVRLTPEQRQPVHTSDRFLLQATSAETNVASVLSSLGEPAKVLTAFVAGSPVAALIKANLRARNLSYEGPELPQGDAWGFRHQFNIADAGFGGRAPRVWNDRAGEVGRELSADQFDLETLFGTEGVKILHLSGLIASLSPKTSQFCLELARAAKAHGTVVSMDMNYRASFWKGREEELSRTFDELAGLCDILYGNEEDFQLCLGIPGPAAGGADIESETASFAAMIGRITQRYPSARWIGTSLREVVSANHHRWGLILWHDGEFAVLPLRDIDVLDRIGGGDGSVGGVLYGIVKGWDVECCARFGWACGALAATSVTDYAAPADEAQVWAIWDGNARVQR